MYIITDKNTHEVLYVLENVHEFENGVYSIVNEQGTKFCVTTSKSFDIYDGKIYVHVLNAPDDLIPSKYCYTEEDGLYINPNYTEPDPYGISDELLEQIKNDTVEEIRQEMLRDAE